MIRKNVAALVLILTCGSANALQAIEGKVALLQPTYLPGVVSFTLTTGNGVCPAGAWLQWRNPDQSNNRAVYATLLAAFTAGKTIRLYFNDGDSTCAGVFMHLID